MIKRFLNIFFVLIALTSCVETVVLGTVVSSVIMLNDISVGGVFDLTQDSRIETAVKKTLKVDEEKKAYKNIDVIVFNGKVLLTGYVYENNYKTKAVSKIKLIKSDIEVIDEITVFGEKYRVNSISDSTISTHVSMFLKIKRGIKSGNHKYNVVDGIVFIIGNVENRTDLIKITDVISRVKGVKKVISYITITNK